MITVHLKNLFTAAHSCLKLSLDYFFDEILRPTKADAVFCFDNWTIDKNRVFDHRIENCIVCDVRIVEAEFLGERKLANLRKLVEGARSFDRSGIFTLSDFITQLSEFVARQPDDVVYFAFGCWKVRPRSDR